MLFQLHFKDYDFKVKEVDGKKLIFDIIRKKFLVITPEEWVRQHILHYLIFEKHYNKNFIAVEYGLEVNSLLKRCDILIFSKLHQPAVIIECKQHDVPLSNEIFEQASRYNLSLQVPYLIITNGIDHIVSHLNLEQKQFHFLDTYPEFEGL